MKKVWNAVFLNGEPLRGLNWLSGPWSGRRQEGYPSSPIIRAECVYRVAPGLPPAPALFAGLEPPTQLEADVVVFAAGHPRFEGRATVRYESEQADFLAPLCPGSLTRQFTIIPEEPQ
jgi:hypothetical protein